MRFLAIVDSGLRSLQRLCDHLAAEHAAHAVCLRAASELHCAFGLYGEELDQAGDKAFGRRCLRHALPMLCAYACVNVGEA